ncbi:fluoride efflux transporter CrcB [Bacteroides sp. OttesenSCG-928-J23]|nr:fluoride efflux transporter CrcB [Bacteroides sp. OttesenSCG-928-J23]MDL2299708.1 fluoride efflux transporter CrcB [Bacteroides sp. OttesenSCG-928-E20]
MKEILFVFLGGGFGSISRYGIHLLIGNKGVAGAFPWSTFCVNIVGSFLIGFFFTLSSRYHLSPETRLLLTVGFCGGFTTFSTFSNECLSLLKDGFYGMFALYMAGSIFLGILAVWAGVLMGK